MSNNHTMQTRELTIESDVKLSATLTLPETLSPNPMPAVLLVPGSGKVDRDVNTPHLQTNIFKLMADFFCRIGVISLRFDKRGCGKSDGNFLEAGLSDFMVDARCALEALKAAPEVDKNKLLVLGHSEGAFIAPSLADACHGLILLSGAASPGHELLPEQPRQLIEEIKYGKCFKARLLKALQIHRLTKWQFDRLIKRVTSTDDVIIKLFGFIPYNAKWLREFYQLDTHKILKQIDIPTLVVGGGEDIQVNAKEVTKTCELIHDAHGVVIKKMNHLLRDVDSPHHFLSLLKEYRESVKQPLASELTETIETWCQQKKFILADTHCRRKDDRPLKVANTIQSL